MSTACRAMYSTYIGILMQRVFSQSSDETGEQARNLHRSYHEKVQQEGSIRAESTPYYSCSRIFLQKSVCERAAIEMNAYAGRLSTALLISDFIFLEHSIGFTLCWRIRIWIVQKILHS